ncbi:MAG: RecB-like helicase [Campylobacteraceae bacterium]|jgi:ATP-dependent exoDNAse (exonuclease V) beta subunit|nr:RecB-like helicase [Campylobacteraceae bacterium]
MKFIDCLALNASAGSGKTFALSIRYIALLLKGAKTSNIIALTFTKKAANEMQHRVYHTLQNLEDHQAELNELSTVLELDKEEILEKKNKILPHFLETNIKISTIDAFFGQILRKFALHLGLMPDFTNSFTYDEKRFQELFLQNVKSFNAYESLLYFVISGQNSLRDFFKFLSLIYEKNSEIDKWQFNRVKMPSDKEVLEIANEIKLKLKSLNASANAVKTFDTDNISKLISKSFWSRDSLNYWEYKKVYTVELDEMFDRLKNALRDFYIKKERYLIGELFFLFTLYKNARFQNAKYTNELSFDDVTNAVYELLYCHIDSDFLYFRLDGAIEHLLIDEFQDTNVVQYKILEPVIREIISGIGTKEFRSFFYVGDTKQSIYRFRGGAKELFSYIVKVLGVHVDSLRKNYRSQREIVEFVNEVFKDKIINYEIQEATKEGGFVKVALNDDTVFGVCESVKMLLDLDVEAEDIAILCAFNSDVLVIEEALEKLGIPARTESTTLLKDSPNVAAIIEFLKYLYFEDEVFWSGFITVMKQKKLSFSMQNDMFGHNFMAVIGDDFEILPDLEGFDKNDTPLHIITLCIKKFKLDGKDSDVIQFLEIANRYDNIESLLFSYDKISEKSSKEHTEGVKILTVHKSKGLEFSYVIVADRIQRERSGGDLLLFDYDDIELKNIFVYMSKRELVDKNYKYAKEKEQKLSAEDMLNQFYVAFTRAKNGLIVVKKESESFFDMLDLKQMKTGMITPSKPRQKSIQKVLKYEALAFGRQNVSAEQEIIEGNLESIHFGLALHFTLEMMSNFDESELENSLICTKNRYGKLLDKEAFSSIEKRILNLIKNEKFQTIIKSGTLLKEQPYVYEGKRKQIDILVEKDDKDIIIDYKSSFFARESHVKQVSEYKDALEVISKKKIEAYLCYLHENEAIITNLQDLIPIS